MFDWLLPLIFLIVILAIIFIIEIYKKSQALQLGALISGSIILAVGLIYALIIFIDYQAQIYDVEIWSGEIVDWDHEEEWEEWIPPQEICTTGANNQQSCTTIPGYYQHHYAENSIKTTDNGWVSVSRLPNGDKMDDNYPNTDAELKEHFPEGTPTASRHSYKNKVNASYSVFKHRDIDLKDFTDLPSYPDSVYDKLYVDRLVGKFPNQEKGIKRLEYWNSKLGHKKQVNIIFVNVGPNKPEEYGFALQDKWEGGNKNDFVVSMSMNKDGTVNWVYPFSWSEVDILKLEVKDYINQYGKIEDIVPIMDEVASMIDKKFVRKEFADFNYLHIDLRPISKVIIWLVVPIALGVRIYFSFMLLSEVKNRRRYYY